MHDFTFASLRKDHSLFQINLYSHLLLLPKKQVNKELSEFDCRVVLRTEHIFFQVQLQCKHNILCG